MWYEVIPPFTENVNKRWKISLSHSTAELGCSVKDINSQKIFLFLTNWACRNNRHLVLKERESLYRWRFGCRRYRGKLIHHFILVFFLYIFSLARPAVRISSLLFFKFDTGDFCDPGLSKIRWPHWFVAVVLPTECFHSRGQHLCKFFGTKEKRLHKKRVQLPEDWFGTPTWPPIHCFGTPIWPPWRHWPVWENPSTSLKRAP